MIREGAAYLLILRLLLLPGLSFRTRRALLISLANESGHAVDFHCTALQTFRAVHDCIDEKV